MPLGRKQRNLLRLPVIKYLKSLFAKPLHWLAFPVRHNHIDVHHPSRAADGWRVLRIIRRRRDLLRGRRHLRCQEDADANAKKAAQHTVTSANASLGLSSDSPLRLQLGACTCQEQNSSTVSVPRLIR